MSESDFSHQLHLAAAGGRNRGGDLSLMTRADHLIRQGERWVIQDVRSARTEVQLDPLRKRKRFRERHVD